MDSIPLNDLARAVRAAAARPDVLDAAGRLYADLSAEIDRRRPRCVVSGRCCRFDEYGHRLYVTTIELAAFIHSAPPVPAGADPTACPYQVNKLCTVHPIRPMGCRIFFCDATSTQWQTEQYESFHARLKQLHLDLYIPYFYVEWRNALSRLAEPSGQAL